MSPALSDLPVRKPIGALESVGFVHARTAGSHAVMRHPDDILTAVSRLVPQHGTVKRGTLGSILRQADLKPDEFLGLLR